MFPLGTLTSHSGLAMGTGCDHALVPQHALVSAAVAQWLGGRTTARGRGAPQGTTCCSASLTKRPHLLAFPHKADVPVDTNNLRLAVRGGPEIQPAHLPVAQICIQ